MKLGRIVVNTNGIRQRPIMGIFGHRFSVDWSSLVSWSSTKISITNSVTGEEKTINLILQMDTGEHTYYIKRSANDKSYKELEKQLRIHVQSKEIGSHLSNLFS